MILKTTAILIWHLICCLFCITSNAGMDVCYSCNEHERDHLCRFPLIGTDALEALACKSAFEGHEKVLHFLLEEECIFPHVKGSFERNPLICAAINGHLNVFKLLLKEACHQGFWMPDQETLNLCCLCASGGGHVDIFQFISFEVFPESSWILTQETLNHCCILAASCGHLDLLKFLFKEVFRHCSFARIPEPDVIERCFLTATQHGHLEVLEFLLRKAPDHCGGILEGRCLKNFSPLIFGGS